MCRLNEKTFNILVGLQTHLDFDQGKDAAEFLNGFYNTIFGALAKVHREPDPAKAFDDIIGAIEPVYKLVRICPRSKVTSRKKCR